MESNILIYPSANSITTNGAFENFFADNNRNARLLTPRVFCPLDRDGLRAHCFSVRIHIAKAVVSLKTKWGRNHIPSIRLLRLDSKFCASFNVTALQECASSL